MATAATPEPINVHDAKTQLSKLLARVEQGEEIVIARAGRPIARLVPVEPVKRSNAFGALKGKYPSVPDEVWFERDEETERLWGYTD